MRIEERITKHQGVVLVVVTRVSGRVLSEIFNLRSGRGQKRMYVLCAMQAGVRNRSSEHEKRIGAL